MTRAAQPTLDHRIADQMVNADALVAWFAPFPGCYDIIDPQLTADQVLAMCGPSRSRAKAGALMTAFVVTRAATGSATTYRDLLALATILSLSERQMAKRQATERHYADEWLAGDEWLDGPSRAEIVALKVIAFVRRHGVAVRARTAIYDLLDWHRWCQLVPSPVVTNTLAVVMGLVDAGTGQPYANRMKLLLGHDHARLQESAVFDAESRAATGQRHTPGEHQERFSTSPEAEDITRSLQKMRGDEGRAYSAIEERELRRLTATERAQAAFAAVDVDGVYRRYNASKASRSFLPI